MTSEVGVFNHNQQRQFFDKLFVYRRTFPIFRMLAVLENRGGGRRLRRPHLPRDLRPARRNHLHQIMETLEELQPGSPIP